MCPTEAISNYFAINKELCINCGTCTIQCSAGVFNATLGTIELAHTKVNYGNICGQRTEEHIPISLQKSEDESFVNESNELNWFNVPITLRQSNRTKAEELCRILKNRILSHEFVPTKMMEPL